MNKRQFEKREIERFVENLDLDPKTGRLIDLLVAMCNGTEACNGRSTEEVIAGCTYLAIRQRGEPISLKNIGENVAVHRKQVCRAFQDIVDSLEIELAPESPIKYVDEFVARLNREFDSQLHEEVVLLARALIHESWGNGFASGSSPTGVAAGAVYLAAQLENKRVTQDEVADVAKVTPGTVRKNAHVHRARYERLIGYEAK